jgi:hypothetical protein
MKRYSLSLIALMTFCLAACETIAPFSQAAYQQATLIKAEAMTLMPKAIESYAAHRTEVEALRLDVEKAYEYAKGRPKNEISTRQWEIIRDPARHSLNGFCEFWKQHDKVGATFIEEAKGAVADQLDTIIGLESGKLKPDSATVKEGN